MRQEFKDLQTYWGQGKDITDRFGLSDYDIALLQQHHKLEFPDSLKDYLKTLGPILHEDAQADDYTDQDGLFDDDAYLWWNRDKLMQDQTWFESGDHYKVGFWTKKVFLFADFFLECVYYGVCCQKGDNFGKIISTIDPDFAANNIYEFIQKRIQESHVERLQEDRVEIASVIRGITKKINNKADSE